MSDNGSSMKEEAALVRDTLPASHMGQMNEIPRHRKGLHFWLIFLAICVSLFLSALEFVSLYCIMTLDTEAEVEYRQ